MSFNPVRAASFGRNRGRGVRHANDPHAGTKHSDIMRRAGLGVTVPLSSREVTSSGFAAILMKSPTFTVRSELVAAGNNLGLGVHKTKNRMVLVRSGSLFVQTNDEVTQEAVLHRLQTGGHINLSAGTVHRIASSGTEDAELLIVEDTGYEQGFEYLEAPEVQGMSPHAVLAGGTPDAAVTTTRRADQTIAKTQAVQNAVQRRRRAPRLGAGPTPAASDGAVGQRAPTTSPLNPNSTNVQGVSPRPMGPGGLGDD